MEEYKTTIGLEIHLELKSLSKFFSPSANAYGSVANTLINEIDLAYPGTLPTINKEVINQGIKAAHLLNCKINKVMRFDRKNYFYPDLAKNYQITQNATPIGYDGYLLINDKKILIHDIHLEEDTAKSIHKDNNTYLDFNRSGVPLLEIVTEPSFDNADDAMTFLAKLQELFKYANISDCKIEEGSMRCDVNISLSKDEKLGAKIEVKNVGSIRSVGEAIIFEQNRQKELLESGKKLELETRRYDETKKETVLMRVKKEAADYRFIADPDILEIELTDEYIDKVINSLGLSADDIREKLKKADILDINISKIINNKELSDYLINLFERNINLVIASNLLLGDISSYLNKTKKTLKECALDYDKFEKAVNLIESETINTSIFKEIIDDLMTNNKSIEELIEGKVLLKDEGVIKNLILEILNNNKNIVDDYKKGNKNASKFLMGQVMKETKGKIDPKISNKILNEILDEM